MTVRLDLVAVGKVPATDDVPDPAPEVRSDMRW
jgi:hypothetical protein